MVRKRKFNARPVLRTRINDLTGKPEPTFELKLKLKGKIYNVIVDASDGAWFMRMHLEKAWRMTDNGYVSRLRPVKDYVKYMGTDRLHRMVLGLDNTDKHQGGHLNGNRCDNRRSNLAVLTNGVNNKSKITSTADTSPYVGVSKCRKRWGARVWTAVGELWLGCHDTQEEAAITYIEKCVDLFPANSYDLHSRIDSNLELLGMHLTDFIN